MKTIIDKNKTITENSKQIEILKKNFPSCFDKDGKFNSNKLEEIVSKDVDINNEGYSLNWLGKSYSRLLANLEVTTMIEEDYEHNQKKENKDSNNIYIEGDNLEVLKHMTRAYSEKIKMIYIDPPYNTGTDFIYKDDRSFTVEELSDLAKIDEDEAKRILEFTNSNSNSHSAWLTFMYPRLYVARELLKEDGVIFISIDDNEQAQLKLLCDEVFGEENTETYIWDLEDKSEGSFTKTASHTVRNMHEYFIACYKNEVTLGKYKEERYLNKNEGFSNPDNDYRGDWMSANISRNGITSKSGSKYYTIETPTGAKYSRNWTVTKSEYEKLLLDNRIYFAKDGEGVPREKLFKNTVSMSIQNSIFKNLKTSKFGKKQIIELLGGEYFQFSKSSLLVKRIIELADVKDNDIVFDFFSGSATTAHAVMDLNARDRGNRKFIMVNLPEQIDTENNKAAYEFCVNELKKEPVITTIGKERIVRAAKKIKQDNDLLLDGVKTRDDYEDLTNVDFGFKVYKTIPAIETNYFKELDTLNVNDNNIIVNNNLSNSDLESILLSWKLYDGIEFGVIGEEVMFDNYPAHYIENKLYLMNKDFENKQIRLFLEKLDNDENFFVRKIIILAVNFTSKELMELEEAVKGYKNKKQIELEIEKRY